MQWFSYMDKCVTDDVVNVGGIFPTMDRREEIIPLIYFMRLLQGLRVQLQWIL